MIKGLPPRMSESAFRSFENYARSMTVDGPFEDVDGQAVFYDVEDRYGRRRRYLVWRGPEGVQMETGLESAGADDQVETGPLVVRRRCSSHEFASVCPAEMFCGAGTREPTVTFMNNG